MQQVVKEVHKTIFTVEDDIMMAPADFHKEIVHYSFGLRLPVNFLLQSLVH